MTSPLQQTNEPTIFILYGATGDLCKRMVIPAFYALAVAELLPDEWILVGNGRGDVSHEQFRDHVHDVLVEFGPDPGGALDAGHWRDFSARLRFAGGGFSVDDGGEMDAVLSEARVAVAPQPTERSVLLIHHLAVPPTAFVGLTKAIDAHGLAEHARVVYEKPFGNSAAGFRDLDHLVHEVFDEDQVFRIDHFLGKAGTQRLHVLRFANPASAGMWNRDHVRAVQIDVPETLGVSDRAEFYDTAGAIRDMLVTHLFQVAAEVAMEPPADSSAASLVDARESVIAAFRPLDPEQTVLGQFEGYRDVDGVAADSMTDTFVATRLWVDTDRWRDVPFLLRTGKQMAHEGQRVSLLLRDPADQVVSFDLRGDGALPPYARLIHDVIDDDHSLFTSSEGLGYAWTALDPIVTDPPPVRTYEAGTWGPPEADALAEPFGWLLSRDGRTAA